MGKTATEFDRELEAATKKGQDRMKNQPLAVAVRWSKTQGLILDLNNGVRLILPLSYLLHPQLHSARPAQLAAVEVVSPGTAIQWPALDEQIGVLELLKDLLGEDLSPLARQLARKGGQSTSDKKKSAARANGTKGGRPRKQAARTAQ